MRPFNSHLTYEERCQIEALLQAGKSRRAIARQMGVSHWTVIREVNRNISQRGYRHKHAHGRACERRNQASSSPNKMTEENITLIIQMLSHTDASPEQISGRLKLEHNIHISHENIYRFIWDDKHQGGKLYEHLRHRAKKYNKRKGKKAGRGLIPNRVDIDKRPAIVEKKKRLGDFELDTIVGANHQGAILSVVDRASKFTFLHPLKKASAKAVTDAMSKRLHCLKDHGLIKTFTADNGKEFSDHQSVVELLGGRFFFAKPYHSWERGLNEHTNGLVRQYLPKGTSFGNLKSQQVKSIEYKLNNRPRKILKFKTPAEVFMESSPFYSVVQFDVERAF